MTVADLGFESGLVLLGVASVAAIQARAVRGAQRAPIEELCERRGRPERSAEIVAASETLAFIAAQNQHPDVVQSVVQANTADA